MSTIGPFEIVGFSNDVKDYKCFEDLGRNEWIDGSELKANAENWTDRQKEKWHFFHRPVRPLVGLAQRLKISELRAHKSWLKQELLKEIDEIRGKEEETPAGGLSLIPEGLGFELKGRTEAGGVTDEAYAMPARETLVSLEIQYRRAFVKMKRGLLIIAIILAVAVPLVSVYDLVYGFAIGGLFFPAFVIFLNNRYEELHDITATKESLHRKIDALWVDYREESDAIEAQVDTLESSIEQLNLQIAARPVASCIESWLDEELRELERESLYTVLADRMENVGARDELFKNVDFGERTPLMIKGWALMQPSNSFANYEAGKKQLFSDIQVSSHKLGTWRPGTQQQPLFRMYYLTFFFFLENKLVIRSFFYDFITEEQFGATEHDFLYSHISDYSIKHIELGDGQWVKDLGMSPLFVSSLFHSRQVSQFTLSASSGAQINTIVTDPSIIKGINQWLYYEQQIRRLIEEHVNNLKDNTAELEELAGMEKPILNKWMKTEENEWTDSVQHRLLESYTSYYDRIRLREQVSPELRRFIDLFDDYLQAKMQDFV